MEIHMTEFNKKALETFRRKLDKFVKPAGDDDCWEWSGPRNTAGYGMLSYWPGHSVAKCITAHRAVLVLAGNMPDPGMVAMHSCDNPPCCNPKHLKFGTQKQNAADKLAKGRNAPRYQPHSRVKKLSDDQVRAIRKDTRKLKDIAAEYGVGIPTISNIKNGKRKVNLSD
jgi:hypothetical protein